LWRREPRSTEIPTPIRSRYLLRAAGGVERRLEDDLGSTLIARLRTLALKGDLFEPEIVAPLLGMNLKADVEKVPHLMADCGGGTGVGLR
jgi:hypothetical protein